MWLNFTIAMQHDDFWLLANNVIRGAWRANNVDNERWIGKQIVLIDQLG